VLQKFADILGQAADRQTAACAFTCYDLETARGVLSASTAARTPIVLLVSEQAFLADTDRLLAASLLECARRSQAQCAVQLDHTHDLDVVHEAFALGVQAVMVDGSRLPYKDNLKLVQRACLIAEKFSGQIEAELGPIEGNEDTATPTEAAIFTSAQQAIRFSSQTDISCLAVSVGNSHGLYKRRPRLQIPLIREIAAHTEVPLSLHGASGIPQEMVKQAIAAGIRKVNVNTDLRASYADTTKKAFGCLAEDLNLIKLHKRQSDAVSRTARGWIVTTSE